MQEIEDLMTKHYARTPKSEWVADDKRKAKLHDIEKKNFFKITN